MGEVVDHAQVYFEWKIARKVIESLQISNYLQTIKIYIIIQKYPFLQISVTLENKMGMKLELIVEVAVPRVVVSIIVIMYVNLVFTIVAL